MELLTEDRGTFRPAEAAKWLGISRDKLERLIARGEISSFKDGQVRLISKRALLAWIDSREAEAS